MAVERRLTELAGPVGGRLHTARSRNDQVATDVALFTREAALAGAGAVTRAHGGAASTPPSATSTGRCRATRTCSAPSRSTSAITCWPTCGCSSATARGCASPPSRRRRCRSAPGALAGVNFDTDRGAVAAELGFERVAPNSIDAVSNRDFVLDYLGAAATCATHLSRLGRRARAVVLGGVRLRRAARRVDERLVDHAPEEEPRRRRAAAGQGAAHRRRTSPPCTA